MGELNPARCVFAVIAGAVFALGVGASDAQPARGSGQVTITMIANNIMKPSFDVLIPNFERVYPGITVNATYETTSVQYQLTTTELQSGNAPDLITAWPGCGIVVSVCLLAKDGYLAPMIGAPWTRFSSPLVISASKYRSGLFVYSPSVSFFGLFTNDTLFRKLRLKIPQTFSQLLALCHQAKARGTVAVLANPSFSTFIVDLALTTVYARDRHWTAELRVGKVTFDGTPGWHQALQEFVQMNTAGCFEAGATGPGNPLADFAQGQGLMTPALSSNMGVIAMLSPNFAFSQHPIPNGSAPSNTVGMIMMGSGPAVNAHSPAANQAAAQTFVNFVARPAQDALEAKLSGGISEYQFVKRQLPAYMSSFAPPLAAHQYSLNPGQSWWNANVGSALANDAVGLLTGQDSIDDVLNAMDAAWKQGPS